MSKKLDKKFPPDDHDPVTYARFWSECMNVSYKFDKLEKEIDALKRKEEDNKVWLSGFSEGFMTRIEKLEKPGR